MITRKSALLVSLLAIAFSTPLYATNHGTATDAAKPSAVAAAAMAEGEVKKVDKSAGKMTIKHGPLANLDMPAMTMVFRVKEPTMLDQVKVGDKIRFTAEKIDGTYTVTNVERGN
jgi:Cu(I)/Ag(I) efflux system periplasmic protein CusF